MRPDDEHSSTMIPVILNDCAYIDVIVHAFLLYVYIFFLHNIVLRVRNKCIYIYAYVRPTIVLKTSQDKRIQQDY